jgi:hypothetical protein
MQMIISMQADGLIMATNTQGHLLAECFFKAEDETAEELRQMGYTSLRHTYPTATFVVETGMESTDVEDLFLEGPPPAAQ